MSNQKLELTWVGKENRPKLEPRILVEGPEKSYHAKKSTLVAANQNQYGLFEGYNA